MSSHLPPFACQSLKMNMCIVRGCPKIQTNRAHPSWAFPQTTMGLSLFFHQQSTRTETPLFWDRPIWQNTPVATTIDERPPHCERSRAHLLSAHLFAQPLPLQAPVIMFAASLFTSSTNWPPLKEETCLRRDWPQSPNQVHSYSQ